MNITPEEVKALYFDKDSIVLPNYSLFQLNSPGGNRLYYAHIPTDTGMRTEFYAGVTTLLGMTVKEAESLAIWRENMGRQEAERYMNERAAYGSLMHSVYTRLLIDDMFNLDELPIITKAYCENNEIPYLKTWARELQKDVTAFSRFLKEYDVIPLCIEAPMKSDTYGFAGTCDLFAWITIEEKGFWGETYKSGEKVGQPKETKKSMQVLALIDYKSNRSGNFYLSHELQLEMYKILIQENFPQFANVPIRLYNFSPKDWKSEPGYHFTEQTGKHNPAVIPAYVTIFRDLQKSDPAMRNILSLSGIIDMSEDEPWNEVITIKTLKSYVEKQDSETRPGEQSPTGEDW